MFLDDMFYGDGAPMAKEAERLGIIGEGAESFIFPSPLEGNKVIGVGVFQKEAVVGILPYATTRNVHNLLNILFPESFPHMFMVKGHNPRHTTRETIVLDKDHLQKNYEFSFYILDVMKKMGIVIDQYDFDYTDGNFLLDQEGSVKYADLLFAGSGIARSIKMDEVKEYLMNKFDKDQDEIESDHRWKQLLIIVRRIKEIDAADQIFASMAEKDSYNLEDHNVRDSIERFSFMNNNEEDTKSRYRISLLLSKAIKAVTEGGYRYVDRQWEK